MSTEWVRTQDTLNTVWRTVTQSVSATYHYLCPTFTSLTTFLIVLQPHWVSLFFNTPALISTQRPLQSLFPLPPAPISCSVQGWPISSTSIPHTGLCWSLFPKQCHLPCQSFHHTHFLHRTCHQHKSWWFICLLYNLSLLLDHSHLEGKDLLYSSLSPEPKIVTGVL